MIRTAPDYQKFLTEKSSFSDAEMGGVLIDSEQDKFDNSAHRMRHLPTRLPLGIYGFAIGMFEGRGLNDRVLSALM